MSEQEKAIGELRAELTTVKHTLASLIVWIAQSANSPIRADEAGQLLKALR
jgi:hypothetical protein